MTIQPGRIPFLLKVHDLLLVASEVVNVHFAQGHEQTTHKTDKVVVLLVLFVASNN